MGWVSGLTVDFGGTIYDDWRLPTTPQPEFSTLCEMGHLYYTELENQLFIPLSTSFTDGLTGEAESFINLKPLAYWSSTEYTDSTNAWLFDFYPGAGNQTWRNKSSYTYNAIAVRAGDVSTSVPEPTTLLLLGSGLVGIVVCKMRLGRKE